MNPLLSLPPVRSLRAAAMPILLCVAGAAGAATQIGGFTLGDGLAYVPLPTPEAGCEIGQAGPAAANWIGADATGTERNERGPSWIDASYANPVQAAALRANLARDALRRLTSIAVWDNQGEWRTVWSGSLSGPVIERCERAWFVHPLKPAGATVAAVRYTFRSVDGAVHMGSAQVLPAAR